MRDDFNSFVEWAVTGILPVPPLRFMDGQEQAGCLSHNTYIHPKISATLIKDTKWLLYGETFLERCSNPPYKNNFCRSPIRRVYSEKEPHEEFSGGFIAVFTIHRVQRFYLKAESRSFLYYPLI